jgi:amidase
MLTTRDPLNAFLDLPKIPVARAQTGPLAGLTLGVKDIFDVAGYVTGCGNPAKFDAGKPATATAPAVKKLLDAGANFVGKTQTEELAFSMLGQNVHFPHPVNPAAPGRVTGGSSSGSVAAVAGGLADIATGSDTGGSVRVPASFCGLIGLRTTQGRIPLDGTMPLAPSFDTFGWFAKDYKTYAAVGDVLLGQDRHAAPLNRPHTVAVLSELVAGPAEAAEYARMVGLVSKVTGKPKPQNPPPHSTDELYWCIRKLQAKEAWAAHGDWISATDRQLGEATLKRFTFGATVSDPEVIAETARRDSFRTELRDMLGDDGFIIMPTAPCVAPKSDGTAEEFRDFRERAICMLCWAGLSGFPQITLPLGEIDGAPFGISLLGPPDSDRALIRLGVEILKAAGRA